METPSQGTQPQEQPGNGTPNPAEQAAVPPGQQAPPAPPQPSVEDLAAQLQQERQQRQHYEQQYTALQPEYTRARQALAQLAGAQPQQAPPDPLEPYIQELTGQGFDDKSSRAVAGMMYKMQQQGQQQLHQQLAATQQAGNVDYVLNQAAQFDPGLFTSQQDYDNARQMALNFVQNGGRIDRDLIVDMQAAARYRASKSSPHQQQPFAPPALPPQPFARGFNNAGGGFQPQPQRGAPSLNKEAQDLQNEINARYKAKT